MDNFIEDNRVVNVQANREIETVKSSLNKRTDGLQSEMELPEHALNRHVLKAFINSSNNPCPEVSFTFKNPKKNSSTLTGLAETSIHRIVRDICSS